MKYLVTPTFSEKATSAGAEVLAAAGRAITHIESSSKEDILSSAKLVLEGNPNIYELKEKGCRVIITFGSDAEGEYILLVDIVVRAERNGLRPLPANDPRTNIMIDPKRNMMIDPTKNMMIDPKRNMMIDPHRNMMIDPTRNMMIDPKRNMMIDVQRNMMIDPKRNMMIDPKRNWLINPRLNAAWDGPILYDLTGHASGFLVRSNEKVASLFDKEEKFIGTIVDAGGKNLNLFDPDGNWIGFMVHNGAGGYNQFDLGNRWIGFLVGEPQPADT